MQWKLSNILLTSLVLDMNLPLKETGTLQQYDYYSSPHLSNNVLKLNVSPV